MSWVAASYVKRLRVAPNGEAITKGEKLVLFVLADYHNEEKGYAWASLSHLAEESLHTRPGVISTLRSLEKKGVLCVNRSPEAATKRIINRYSFPGLASSPPTQTGQAILPAQVRPPDQIGHVTLPALAMPDNHIFPDNLSNDLSKDLGAGQMPDTGVHSVLKQKRRPEQPKGEATYQAYAEGHLKRYRVEPIRNAKTNALVCQLVDRLGAEEAPWVARFYVSLETPLYVKAGHPLNLLVRDCESLRTQWKTGSLRSPMIGSKAFQPAPTVNKTMTECPPEAAAALSRILGRAAFSFSADRGSERLASPCAEKAGACG